MFSVRLETFRLVSHKLHAERCGGWIDFGEQVVNIAPEPPEGSGAGDADDDGIDIVDLPYGTTAHGHQGAGCSLCGRRGGAVSV